MKQLAKPLIFLWRVWFYVVVFISIVVLFPFIFVTSLRESWYPAFFRFARIWAWMVLLGAGFWVKTTWLQKPEKQQVYIISPNHTSMIDIMVTLAIFKNCFLFIGKKELAKMPLFGFFYKKTNLLVDRKSLRSRQNVFLRAADKIDEKVGLCIFPEGGVPDKNVELAPFKMGAFRLSVDKQIPIIPVSYPDNKRHFPFDFSKGSPGVLRAVVHPFLVPKENSAEEIKRLSAKCREAILDALEPENSRLLQNEFG